MNSSFKGKKVVVLVVELKVKTKVLNMRIQV
jgi:hypothetical protein